uniref:Laminin alpha domain-containing protein n=2 Tax=Fundulus heteroclitus TaxID=8078 RepID=A0A3Q2QIW5_FUNHE
MMDQLNEAEEELKRKKDEADSDMMMAAMASDNAKQAEDNARKAKSTVKTVLKIILDLMDQLGNLDKVDLSKLNRIDESLKRAKDKMAGSELDKKLADLNDVASTQKEMIDDYERQIREIRSDIANLNDIKNTLPEGCFNSAALEQP